jgi:hypothetical protein
VARSRLEGLRNLLLRYEDKLVRTQHAHTTVCLMP